MDSQQETTKRYNVYRYSYNGRKRLIRTNLTLADAQAICRDPETSSETATRATRGRWFYGFEQR